MHLDFNITHDEITCTYPTVTGLMTFLFKLGIFKGIYSYIVMIMLQINHYMHYIVVDKPCMYISFYVRGYKYVPYSTKLRWVPMDKIIPNGYTRTYTVSVTQ